ncbi:unnamed protein product, partial [Polarella glacialis]
MPDSLKARFSQSEASIIVLGIVRIVLLLLWLNHLLACCFYGLAAGEENSWLDVQQMNGRSVGERYVASLFWSITMFAGQGNIYPVSTSERIYSIIVFLCVYMISATMVSSITSSLTRLEIATASDSSKLMELKRFLKDHCISPSITLRVQRNATHAMQQKRSLMPEGDVELLQLISEPLRVELHFEMHMPLFKEHPFFYLYAQVWPMLMKQVCHTCIAHLGLSNGDVVFNQNEYMHEPAMFFVSKGRLRYTKIAETQETEITTVKYGDWAAEAVLWTPWMHVGTLVSTTD